MITKKYILALTIASLFSTYAYGKGAGNELSAEITGGLSTMYYSHIRGNYDPMMGTGAAINYTHRFNDSWGMGVGAGIRLYQSRIRFDSYTDYYTTTANSIPGVNKNMNNLDFHYTYVDLEDQQRVLYFTIPLFAQYEHKSGFYSRLGVQLGIPINGGSTIHYDELRTKGTFTYENATYDNSLQHGFGTYRDGAIDVSSSYKINTSITAEVGWNWSWDEQFVLYLGVNGEYGFCNMFERESTQPQLIYNNGDFLYTPIFETDLNIDGNRTPITGDKIHSYSLNMVIRYSFGW